MLHTPEPYAVTRPHPLAFQMWQSPSLPAGQEATLGMKAGKRVNIYPRCCTIKRKKFFFITKLLKIVLVYTITTTIVYSPIL